MARRRPAPAAQRGACAHAAIEAALRLAPAGWLVAGRVLRLAAEHPVGPDQPVNRGATAVRAQRLNVTRSVRDLVPLASVNCVTASTRWVPRRSEFGRTASAYRLPRFGRDSVLTFLPSR